MGLKSEIDSCFQSVSSGKAQIASAITGKGVSTSSSASFSTMASNIGKIKSGASYVDIVPGTANERSATSSGTNIGSYDILVGVDVYSSGGNCSITIYDIQNKKCIDIENSNPGKFLKITNQSISEDEYGDRYFGGSGGWNSYSGSFRIYPDFNRVEGRGKFFLI